MQWSGSIANARQSEKNTHLHTHNNAANSPSSTPNTVRLIKHSKIVKMDVD